MNAWLTHVLLSSAIGTGFGLLFLLARRLLAARAGIAWRELAFLLLAVYLLAPVRLPSPTSVYAAAPEGMRRVMEAAPVRSPLHSRLQAQTMDAPAWDVPWENALLFLWAAGALISAAVAAMRALRLHLRLRAARPCAAGRGGPLLERAAHEAGLSQTPALLCSPVGPAARGLLHPAIYLSEEALALPEEQLYLVLLHEAFHVKRLDVGKLMLWRIVRCVHWFNPMVACLLRALREDMEQACDAALLRRLPAGERGVYGHMLVAMASSWGRHGLPTAARHPLAGRIRHIARFRVPSQALVSCAVAGVLVTAALLLTVPLPVRAAQTVFPTAEILAPRITVFDAPASPAASQASSAAPPMSPSPSPVMPSPLPTATSGAAEAQQPAADIGNPPKYGEPVPWHTLYEDGLLPEGEQVSVVDLRTRRTFTVTCLTPSERHLDFTPSSTEDAKTLKRVYGGTWSWERRSALAYVGGVWVAASMNGMPHAPDAESLDNGVEGQFCMHFLGSRNVNTGLEDRGHQAAVARAAGLR